MIETKFKKLHPDAIIPTRGTEEAAGMDLYALEDCIIPPCSASALYCADEIYTNVGQAAIRTGVAVAIDNGLFGKVESRSGSSFKFGIETGAGVIDSDYRGEVKVKLYNFTAIPYPVMKGDRIAQLIILPYVHSIPKEDPDMDMGTERGANGFGHTGK